MAAKKKATLKKTAANKAVKKPIAKQVKKSVGKAVIKKTAKKTIQKTAKKTVQVKKSVSMPKAKIESKIPVKNTAPQPKAKAPQKKASTKKQTQREKSIHKIHLMLIGQKNALLHEAESAINQLPEQSIFPDLGDQATAETDRNFMLRLKGREQRLINKIEEAIDRILTRSYGICESCGEEITVSRLEARPVTTLCIECKTEQEEEEKLQGS